MTNDYGADLLAASKEVQRYIITYDRLAVANNSAALNAFVDNLCGPTSGSEIDQLWLDFLILRYDTTRMGSHAVCLHYFMSLNELFDQAVRLKLDILADEINVLATRVLAKHTSCITRAYAQPAPTTELVRRDMVNNILAALYGVVIAGTLARELYRARKR